MVIKAEDLEELDNLDPDDFDESMDTAEARGDVVDPNEGDKDETDNEATEDDATDVEPDDEADDGDDDGDDGDDAADSGESDSDESTDADDVDADADADADAEDDEVEADADADADADDDEPEGDDPRIPKSRFDSVNARRKDAERRLAELQAQIDKTGESGQRADRVAEIQSELGEIDDQINDAILDADAAKLKELRAKERELNNEALDFRLKNATSQAAAEAKYDALLDKVEADYPEYNPDSEDSYNEEMVSETLRLQKALMLNGSSKGDALLEAIDLVRPRYVQEDAATGKLSLRDKPKPKRETKTNTKRNKKVAKSQPAATASRSSKLESSEDIDFDNIQQPEDIDKYDEKTLARLSGDVVD